MCEAMPSTHYAQKLSYKTASPSLNKICIILSGVASAAAADTVSPAHAVPAAMVAAMVEGSSQDGMATN